MRYSFHTEQWVPFSINQVFEFFSNPDNLPLLMPAWQKSRIDQKIIIAPPSAQDAQTTRAAGSGSRVTLSFLPFPLAPFRVRWLAEIAEFKWNERFCDRQIKGPFAYWSHCHYIRPTAQSGVNGTIIADDLEYELPMGMTGEIAHRLVLRRQIERTFQFRQAQVVRVLAQNQAVNG